MQIKSKIVLPRNYVIALSNENNSQYVHPFGYVLAMTALTPFERIENWVQVKAELDKEDPNEILGELEQGIVKEHGNDDLLKKSRRDIVSNVQRFARNFKAEIESKEEKEKEPYKVTLGFNDCSFNEFVNMFIDCKCDNHEWNGVKDKRGPCLHQTILGLALYSDTGKRNSPAKSITGLDIQKRKSHYMPFSISGLENAALDSLLDYYVYNKGFFDINLKLSQNEDIYSNNLKTRLRDPKDSSTGFYVVRQKEMCFTSKNEEDKRYFEASSKLIGKIGKRLGQYGFRFQGYQLEFVGNDEQCVARRYQKGNRVFSVCHSQTLPPIIVDRTLLSDNIKLVKYSEEYMDHPLNREPVYDYVDDVTRLIAATSISTPDQLVIQDKNLGIEVPEIVSQRYNIN